MWKSGANFRDRNDIIAYHKEGLDLEKIRALTKVNMDTIKGIIAEAEQPDPPKEPDDMDTYFDADPEDE